MKLPLTTIHSGKRYTFTPADKIEIIHGKPVAVRRRGQEPGVWIEDLEGLNKGRKVWRPNSSFPHITGLRFKDLTTRATL